MQDLIGKKFNELTILTNPLKGLVSTRCSCGNIKDIKTWQVTSGWVKTCGCGRDKGLFKTKHNMSFTHEYNSWQRMKGRCLKPDTPYALKGITICDRWINSFENFFSDMGPAPSKKHTIDRIENKGNYEPSNCRWATQKEQNNNYSQNRVVTFNGETMNITQWAEKLNLPRHRIYQRLNKGWSIEKTLTTPVKKI